MFCHYNVLSLPKKSLFFLTTFVLVPQIQGGLASKITSKHASSIDQAQIIMQAFLKNLTI